MEEKKKPSKVMIIFLVMLVLFLALVGGSAFYANKTLFESNSTNNKKEPVNTTEPDTNETNETTEPETDNVVYEDNKVTYDRCANSFKKVFTYEDYLVCQNTDYEKYENTDNDLDSLWTKYYVVNNKTKTLFAAYNFTKEDESDAGSVDTINYYFIAYEDDDNDEAPYVRGMFSLNNEKVLVGFSDYSCQFHSDDREVVCNNVDATMVQEHASDTAYFGLVSLKDYSYILNVEYESMYELGNNFMVGKKNKYGLYTNEGKKLLDVKYDYLGYNDYIGYVGIIGNNVELYNTKLEKQDLSNKSLKDVFKEAYSKFNQEKENDEDYLFMQGADSYYWTVGSSMRIHNISEPFDLNNENNYRYKYTGNKYEGEQLVINSHCTYNYIYVIQNNKAYKIDSKEIYKPQTDSDAFCF